MRRSRRIHGLLQMNSKVCILKSRQGALLAGLAITVALVTLLIASVPDGISSKFRVDIAERMCSEIAKIGHGAERYYVSHQSWPSGYGDLVAEGYLPSGFSGTSPFGDAYTFISSERAFRINVPVPDDVSGVITSRLSLSSYNAGNLTFTVLPPGIPGGADNLLARRGTDEERTMGDSLEMNNLQIHDLADADPAEPGHALNLDSAEGFYLHIAGGDPGGVMTGVLETPEIRASRIYDKEDNAYHEDPSGTGNIYYYRVYDMWVRAANSGAGEWLSVLLKDSETFGDMYCGSTSGNCCGAGYIMLMAGSSHRVLRNKNYYPPGGSRYSVATYNPATGQTCINSTEYAGDVVCCRTHD
jgi:hypothetical protein